MGTTGFTMVMVNLEDRTEAVEGLRNQEGAWQRGRCGQPRGPFRGGLPGQQEGLTWLATPASLMVVFSFHSTCAEFHGHLYKEKSWFCLPLAGVLQTIPVVCGKSPRLLNLTLGGHLHLFSGRFLLPPSPCSPCW